MKNDVQCYKDFFPYFKALKTNCEHIAWQRTMYRAHYFLNIEIDVCIQSDEF